MSVYKQEDNRNTMISFQKTNGIDLKPSCDFCLYLSKGNLVLSSINGRDFFLCGNTVVCANNLDIISFIYPIDATIDLFQFAPSFINVNLNWDMIRSSDYKSLSERHDYPDFKPFLDRSLIYNGLLVLDEASFSEIIELISRINDQLISKPDGKWSCRSRSYLFKLLSILDLHYKKYIGDYSHDPLVWELRQYIDLHLNSELSLKQLCTIFSINRTSLSERFKSALGMTIMEYIKEKRMSHVKRLLEFTELSCAEIGEQVGYNDASYLTRVFVKEMNITPLKYRQMMRAARNQSK